MKQDCPSALRKWDHFSRLQIPASSVTTLGRGVRLSLASTLKGCPQRLWFYLWFPIGAYSVLRGDGEMLGLHHSGTGEATAGLAEINARSPCQRGFPLAPSGCAGQLRGPIQRCSSVLLCNLSQEVTHRLCPDLLLPTEARLKALKYYLLM